MHHLGNTRSSYQRDHLLLTPDTFVRAPLPGMKSATAVVHAGRATGAGFTQYTAEFDASGSFATAIGAQRFVYVLEGSVNLATASREAPLAPGQYAYVPPPDSACIKSDSGARAVIIEKEYLPLNGPPPTYFMGDQRTCASQLFNGDEAVEVRTLIPDEPRFDFAVNIMTFLPGGTLPMVEIHVMEHGLLMLEGQGIYRLNDRWYPVAAGDFIWMAPHCPQWFGALGKKPAKYLIYKDWNRLQR